MKLKRFVAAVITVLLIISSLAFTALAADEGEAILYQPVDGGYSKTGSWQGTTNTSLYADDTNSVFSVYSTAPGATVTYTNLERGTFDVYVWNAVFDAAPTRDDQSMEVVVNSVDGTSEVFTPRRDNPIEGWVLLGTYNLSRNSSVVFTAGSEAGNTDSVSNNTITARVGSIKLVKSAVQETFRDTIVAYPEVTDRARTYDATAEGGGIFTCSGFTDGALNSGFKSLQTDVDIGRPYSGDIGYTNLWPYNTLANNADNMAKGVKYEPGVSAEKGTAGWYAVYVERLVQAYNDPSRYVDHSVLHVEVRHKGGRSQYVMNTNLEDGVTRSADLVYVGTFYFDGGEDSVTILTPYLRNPKASSDASRIRFDFGGAKFVPVSGPAAPKGYYNPVFSDTLADGINTTWYETTGTAAFDFALANVRIPVDSSLKIKYDANDDAKDAVAFTDGSIRFDMIWRNTTANDASASVVIGKSASKNAEFKIYSEKVEYWENGSFVKEIPIFAYYANDYEPKKDGTYNSWHPNTLCGENENVHTMRLEISEPELTTADISLTDAGIAENEKTVKLIINEGKSVARVMAMGTLPANSVLFDADSDITDNYIEFKNNGGATDNADISIGNISVMVPDDELKSDNIYSTSYNDLKYTDFKDEFNPNAGVITVETDLVKPAEITNLLINKNEKPVFAIFAPFALSGKLDDAPTIYNLGVLPGTKKSVRFVLDSEQYLDTNLKFFIWDSLESLVPAQEMQRVYVK